MSLRFRKKSEREPHTEIVQRHSVISCPVLGPVLMLRHKCKLNSSVVPIFMDFIPSEMLAIENAKSSVFHAETEVRDRVP